METPKNHFIGTPSPWLDGNTWRENLVLLAKEQRRLVRLLFFLKFEWILQLFEIIQEMTEKNVRKLMMEDIAQQSHTHNSSKLNLRSIS